MHFLIKKSRTKRGIQVKNTTQTRNKKATNKKKKTTQKAKLHRSLAYDYTILIQKNFLAAISEILWICYEGTWGFDFDDVSMEN